MAVDVNKLRTIFYSLTLKKKIEFAENLKKKLKGSKNKKLIKFCIECFNHCNAEIRKKRRSTSVEDSPPQTTRIIYQPD